MNEQKMHALKDKLCKELDVLADRNEISASDLEMAHKLTDTIKNIQKMEMLEYGGGYSGDDDYRGNSYRSRDSMGRYSGNDYNGRSYSRGTYYRDGIRDRLESLMDEAGTERERAMIRKCMDMM